MGWAIALHGGAGVDPALSLERQQEARDVLLRCLNIGVSALKAGLSAIDVVELVVRELETDPVFNSGRGSALTAKGTVEMEAGVMDGFRNKCGAVSGISTVKNPVSLARLVMDKSPHVYLGFDGAEEFARQQGVEIVDANYFITPENVERLEQAQQQNSIQFDYRLAKGEKLNGYEHLSTLKTYGAKDKAFCIDPASNPSENGSFCSKIPADPHMNGVPIQIYQPETVGCVAVDLNGHCAAATSTGGLINKMHGRIGDSPLIGAGTYANGLCAVSATGEGEALIRATVGRDVAAVMEYKALSLRESVDFVINKRLEHGKGGVIAISCNGEVAAGFNCIGMFRACATEDGYLEVGIWE